MTFTANTLLALLALSAAVSLEVSSAPLLTSHLRVDRIYDTRQPSKETATEHHLQCRDPLRHLVPKSTCQAGTGRDGRTNDLKALDAVYLMSEHDGCPARPVCLSDKEISACRRRGHHVHSQLHSCPDWAPVPVLEYSTVPQRDPEQDGDNDCPVLPQPRCVRLDCFEAFCRARARPASGHAAEDKTRRHRPVLEILEDRCTRLHCGCPATEAQLFAEGCPTPGEHLILMADARSGCPVKLCLPIVPHWVEPSQLPSSSTKKPRNCSRQPDCPAGTYELTVASPDHPERCPLRVCLLSGLLDEPTTTDAALNEATSASPAALDDLTTTGSTYQSSTDHASISATTSSPETFVTTSEATTTEDMSTPGTVATSRDVIDSTFDHSTASSTTASTSTQAKGHSVQEGKNSDHSLRNSETEGATYTMHGGTTSGTPDMGAITPSIVTGIDST